MFQQNILNSISGLSSFQDAMEDASTEQVENVSNDVQEAEMEETANENDEGTEEAVANVSVSQDQEMKTEDSTKGKVTFKKVIGR